MKLPKYVRDKSGTYHYQRDYPLKLRHICQKKTFTYPLKLSVNNATSIQLTKATIEAEEAFERQKRLISNSDPDALSATELDKAATDFLRKRGLSPAQFIKVATDVDISAKEEQDQQQLQDHGYNFADYAIPEFDDVLHKQNMGEPLSVKDKVIGEAYLKLINKAKAKPRTLSSLWREYAEYRGIDPKTRGGKKANRYWDRWLSLAGDAVISPNTLQHINDGMDAYVLERQGKVSSQSLKRELADVAACLRLASKQHRFGWFIELPFIKETQAKKRNPLEPDEQTVLVKAILAPSSQINPKYGVAMLLCLQGGMMVSEIERLEVDDIGLDTDIPHLKIGNQTKNASRQRIVPIVLGLGLIKEHLADTIKWIANSTESTPSATLKKIMRKITGNQETSPHCLRHTFKINAQEAGVSVLTIASIAGWSDAERGASQHLLNYGATGIAQSKITRKLYQDSLEIHKNLITLEATLDDNVLAFRRKE